MCSRSAARPKCSSSATATKYRSLRRSRSIIPSGYYSGRNRSWTAAARRPHRGKEFPTTKGHVMSLQNQRVVVLGGTSGIGLATARLAADQGATVIVASSNPESVKRALEALPDSASGEAVDLTDSAAVAAFFNGIEPFDHLVFTAGEALTLLEIDSLDLDKARQAFELRYFAALGAVSAAASKIRPGGSVVLTTGA